MRPAYPALQTWIAPARARAELWRLVVGMVLIAAVYLMLNTGLVRVLVGISPELARDVLGTGGTGQGSTPQSLLVILFSFVLMGASVAVALRVAHQRSLWTVLGPAGLVRSQFTTVLVLLALVGLVLLVMPPYGMGVELVQPRPFASWLALLPLGLAAVLVQTGAEEILFRGYIQQQLAARFRSPLVWMVLPSLLFALGHYMPAQAGENALLVAAWSGVFGILMADLTARAGSLGPAIAVHFANNAAALLFVSLPDSLSGLALFVLPVSMSDTEFVRDWLLLDFVTMLVFWLAARLALRR